MGGLTPRGFGNRGGEGLLTTEVWLSCFCGLESDSSVRVVRVLWWNRSYPPAGLTQGDECPLPCSAAVGIQPQLSHVEAEAAGLRAGRRAVERVSAGTAGTDQLQGSCRSNKTHSPHLSHFCHSYPTLGWIPWDQQSPKVNKTALFWSLAIAQLVHSLKTLQWHEEPKFSLHKIRSCEAWGHSLPVRNLSQDIKFSSFKEELHSDWPHLWNCLCHQRFI